jgi:hypothetical protein
MIGDNFLAIMENTALHLFPVGTFPQLDGATLTSVIMFVSFWTGSFLLLELEAGNPFLIPTPYSSPDMTPLNFFFWRFFQYLS